MDGATLTVERATMLNESGRLRFVSNQGVEGSARLNEWVREWGTPLARDANGPKRGKNAQGSAPLSAQVRMEWPTPTASETGGRNTLFAQGGTPLSMAARHWPTPTVCGNHNRKGASPTSQNGLATVVRSGSARPTPTGSMLPTDDVERSRSQGRKAPAKRAHESGSLNPEWVEALMGFPIGWTDLGHRGPAKRKPSGSHRGRRARSRRDAHG